MADEFSVVLWLEVVEDVEQHANGLWGVDGPLPVRVHLHEACSLLLDLGDGLRGGWI